jgi:hypothetical protein
MGSGTLLSAPRRLRLASSALLATVLLAAVAAPVAASDPCPNGGNRLANCGFEAPGGLSGDTSSWDDVVGDEFEDTSVFFHSGGFSARIDAAAPAGAFETLIQTCAEGVVPEEIYLFGAWRLLVGADAAVTCAVAVEEHGASETPCAGSLLEQYFAQSGSSADWEEMVSKFVANAAARDVLLLVSCVGDAQSPQFQLHVDDAYLIPLAVVFHDDFEFAPDSCAWSASVGGGCD